VLTVPMMLIHTRIVASRTRPINGVRAVAGSGGRWR
jgi:hypothetical protein